MTTRLLIVALASLALGLPAGAGAISTPLTPLKIGDAVDILNTNVACYAVHSDGKDGIGCVILKGSNIKTGSYGVGIAVDGTAVVNKVKADGSSTHVFKKRLPASRSASAKVYPMKPGQGFGIPVKGDKIIACEVVNVTSTAVEPFLRGIKVTCHFSTSVTSVANTYVVAISDRFAGVFKITPQHTASTWGIVKQQPK